MLGITTGISLLAPPPGPRPETAPAACRPSTDTGRRAHARSTHGDEHHPPVTDLTKTRSAADITVPVRFHVLASGRTGLLSVAEVNRQIAILNVAYSGGAGGADTGVRFALQSVDRTDRPEWFQAPHTHESTIKRLLHRGGAQTLNLYTASVGDEILGFSTFPQWVGKSQILDGVVVDYRSLPGGAYQHFNLGYTAVHETGHWLGLFHTFENGCNHPGDGVADTPDEGYPTDGCPRVKNTCTSTGDDPLHNFMDYAWDDCMREFTPGQAARIHQSWAAYRGNAESSA
ncbi:MAG: zinc metalloprotease [Streptosporangiaceae bacterium]